MAQPWSGTITLNSSTTTSPALMLDPTARQTNINVICNSLTTSGSTTCTFNVQVSLDVNTASSLMVWDSISSALYTSSGTFAGGIQLSIAGPIAGIRLLSSGNWAVGTVSLQALQEIIA